MLLSGRARLFASPVSAPRTRRATDLVLLARRVGAACRRRRSVPAVRLRAVAAADPAELPGLARPGLGADASTSRGCWRCRWASRRSSAAGSSSSRRPSRPPCSRPSVAMACVRDRDRRVGGRGRRGASARLRLRSSRACGSRRRPPRCSRSRRTSCGRGDASCAGCSSLGDVRRGGLRRRRAAGALRARADRRVGRRLPSGSRPGRRPAGQGWRTWRRRCGSSACRSRGCEVAARQVAGVFHVRGVHEGGQPLLVKVYGRDAHDTQIVESLWRSDLVPGGRRPSAPRPAPGGRARGARDADRPRRGRLRRGIVVTAAATAEDDALLVLRGERRSRSRRDDVDRAFLDDAWQALARLDRAKIAHRRIELGGSRGRRRPRRARGARPRDARPDARRNSRPTARSCC